MYLCVCKDIFLLKIFDMCQRKHLEVASIMKHNHHRYVAFNQCYQLWQKRFILSESWIKVLTSETFY